jgi:hypothetical protein
MGNEHSPQIGKDLVTLAEAVRHVAEVRLKEKDWSGMPLPVPGLDLVLEPRYKRQSIAEFRWEECYDENGNRISLEKPPVSEPSDYRTANSWWSERLKAKIYILKDSRGHVRLGGEIESPLLFTLRTLQAAAAWPLEAEKKAMNKLAKMIPAEMFELYQLTGHFSEVSARSQVTYLFRRGRPTIAMREVGEEFHVLCALCLHPIGYYGQTWAGVMCPTDEVIAHLLMMRGSEEKYWANANQHSIEHPAAGV